MINNKNYIIKIGSFASILMFLMLCSKCYTKNKNEIKENYSKVRINTVSVSTQWKDSVLVKMYLEIPYKSLQFIKNGNEFVSAYDAQISVMNNNGKLLYKNIWSDSIFVNNYIKTTSKDESVVLFSEAIFLSKTILVLATVLDIESRNFYKTSVNLNLDNSKSLFVNEPVLLLHKIGNWGFKNNLMPSWDNFLYSGKDSVNIFISGACSKQKCKLEWKISNNSKIDLISENVTINVENNYFYYYLKYPISIFSDISYTLNMTIKSGNLTDKKSQKMIFLKPGISKQIIDFDDAIEQMKYILTTEELDTLKKIKTNQKENLFKLFWDSRDPTPNSLKNELMEEYYNRVSYSDEHFSGFQDGWKTDMGMVYILFGYPDEVKRYSNHSNQKSYEIWYYFSINKTLRFVDVNGFGEYQLESPHYLSTQ